MDKYQTGRALRPFSFSVALVTGLTGIVTAANIAEVSVIYAMLLLLACVLLQAGVNLINDYSDLQQYSLSDRQQRAIRRNARYGASCFAVAALIAAYFVYLRGLPVLLLVVLGAAGALGYTLEPLNLKRRGLAVFAVFWLMGVWMVSGISYLLTAQFSWLVVLQSVPVGLLSALLLLANEIRDIEQDWRDACRTLSVRLGLPVAASLYRLLLVVLGAVCLLLWALEVNQLIWPVICSLPLMWRLPAIARSGHWQRRKLPPLTGRFYLVFGLLYITTL